MRRLNHPFDCNFLVNKNICFQCQFLCELFNALADLLVLKIVFGYDQEV